MHVKDVSTLRAYWEKEYECTDTPFDIEGPDEWIADLESRGKIGGDVLDAGCGPGRTSIFLAGKGYDVLGVDISKNAVERAARRAALKGCGARFVYADICGLSGYDGTFDTVVDIGCLHSLPDGDARVNYAAALHRMCRDGAVVYLRAFSDMNLKREGYPAGRGLPALGEADIRAAFSDGWFIRDLVLREIDILGDGGAFKRGFCWFAEILRA